MLNLPEIDMDAWIENKQQMNITKMFTQYGEEYFRNVESTCLREISLQEASIVSCGGGAVLRNENVSCMKETGCIVLLTAIPETVYHRVKHSTNRPLLNGNMNVEYISMLMERRRTIYESACDCIVSTDGKNPTEIAEEIIAFYSTL